MREGGHNFNAHVNDSNNEQSRKTALVQFIKSYKSRSIVRTPYKADNNIGASQLISSGRGASDYHKQRHQICIYIIETGFRLLDPAVEHGFMAQLIDGTEASQSGTSGTLGV